MIRQISKNVYRMTGALFRKDLNALHIELRDLLPRKWNTTKYSRIQNIFHIHHQKRYGQPQNIRLRGFRRYLDILYGGDPLYELS